MEPVPHVNDFTRKHRKWGNFFVTVFASFLASTMGSVYIVWKIEPNKWSMVGLLILIGYTGMVGIAVLLFAFSRPRNFDDTPKRLFRKQLRKGLLLAVALLILLLLRMKGYL